MDPKYHAGYDQPGDAGAGAVGPGAAGVHVAQPPAYQPNVAPPPVQHQPMQPYMPVVQPQMVVVQQPRPTTTVVVNGPRRPPVRTWNTGMCSCFDDCTSCCLVMFFAPCYACHLAGRMDESCCVGMPGCVPGGLMALRTKLRIQENIEGSICNDFCTTYWCMHCALCQLSREVDFVQARDAQQGNSMAVVVNTGY